MNVEVKVPTVGESITSGILSVWHKKDGESVNAGDILFTLETDKVSTEVNAPEAGILRTQAAEGDEVKIDQVVAVIEPASATAQAETPAEPAKPEPAAEETRRTRCRGASRASSRDEARSRSTKKSGSSRTETEDYGTR